MRFNTKLLHGNFDYEERNGSTTLPIYQSTSFFHRTAEELEEVFNGERFGFVYSRINNPTIAAFEKRVANLENGIGAVACASGMAAITLAVMNILESGDEIVSGSAIFGGTYSLFKNLEAYGVKTRYAKNVTIENFKRCINEKTKLIFLETIGNPGLDIPDIKKISVLAHERGIPIIVDNTVTTPYLIRPIEWGADIVIHSTSKYINGSGNSIGGIIVDSGSFEWDSEKFVNLKKYLKFGRFAFLAKLRKGIFKDFGACMSPFNAFLSIIGLETLGIRMERICYNADKLAAYLNQHSKVKDVNYPGLKENKAYELSSKQFSGKFGGIMTIRMGSKDNAFKLINNLKYPLNLANLGDVRTLVIHPASTIYAEYGKTEKEGMGVYEDLIRISVGLEDIEDLLEDFEQALKRI